MTRSPSQRMRNVQDPVIARVGVLIAEHPGTINLGQGMVHYAPPPQVVQAVADAAQHNQRVHRYGHVRGRGDLIAAIKAKLHSDNRVLLGEDRRVVVTAGSNMGFLNAVLAITDVDDEIVILTPYYFNHEMALAIAGCRAVAVSTDDNYQPDMAKIKAAINDRTKAIVTISPNNPTGAVYPLSVLQNINELCASHGLYHICDEAYEYFVYDGLKHYSPGSSTGSAPHTISLYSLSKSYGLAGWRIGYMVIPEHLASAVEKIQDTNLICPTIVSQIAACTALQVGAASCRQQAAELQSVRNVVLSELGKLRGQIEMPQPRGAFYAFARVRTDRRDMEIVNELICQYGVAVIPGSTFGVTDGCALRIAYGALDGDSVAEGIARLVKGLRALC